MGRRIVCGGGLWVGVGWGGSKSFWGLAMVHPLLSIESLPAHPHHPTHPPSMCRLLHHQERDPGLPLA